MGGVWVGAGSSPSSPPQNLTASPNWASMSRLRPSSGLQGVVLGGVGGEEERLSTGLIKKLMRRTTHPANIGSTGGAPDGQRHWWPLVMGVGGGGQSSGCARLLPFFFTHH